MNHVAHAICPLHPTTPSCLAQHVGPRSARWRLHWREPDRGEHRHQPGRDRLPVGGLCDHALQRPGVPVLLLPRMS
jgi:hypothetical protein